MFAFFKRQQEHRENQQRNEQQAIKQAINTKHSTTTITSSSSEIIEEETQASSITSNNSSCDIANDNFPTSNSDKNQSTSFSSRAPLLFPSSSFPTSRFASVKENESSSNPSTKLSTTASSLVLAATGEENQSGNQHQDGSLETTSNIFEEHEITASDATFSMESLTSKTTKTEEVSPLVTEQEKQQQKSCGSDVVSFGSQTIIASTCLSKGELSSTRTTTQTNPDGVEEQEQEQKQNIVPKQLLEPLSLSTVHSQYLSAIETNNRSNNNNTNENNIYNGGYVMSSASSGLSQIPSTALFSTTADVLEMMNQCSSFESTARNNNHHENLSPPLPALESTNCSVEYQENQHDIVSPSTHSLSTFAQIGHRLALSEQQQQQLVSDDVPPRQRLWFSNFTQADWQRFLSEAEMILSALSRDGGDTQPQGVASRSLPPLPPRPPSLQTTLEEQSEDTTLHDLQIQHCRHVANELLPSFFFCPICHDLIVGAVKIPCRNDDDDDDNVCSCCCGACWQASQFHVSKKSNDDKHHAGGSTTALADPMGANIVQYSHALDVAIMYSVQALVPNDGTEMAAEMSIPAMIQALYYQRVELWRREVMRQREEINTGGDRRRRFLFRRNNTSKRNNANDLPDHEDESVRLLRELIQQEERLLWNAQHDTVYDNDAGTSFHKSGGINKQQSDSNITEPNNCQVGFWQKNKTLVVVGEVALFVGAILLGTQLGAMGLVAAAAANLHNNSRRRR